MIKEIPKNSFTYILLGNCLEALAYQMVNEIIFLQSCSLFTFVYCIDSITKVYFIYILNLICQIRSLSALSTFMKPANIDIYKDLKAYLVCVFSRYNELLKLKTSQFIKLFFIWLHLHVSIHSSS